MRRFPASLKAVCGKLLTAFLKHRLRAELPQAEELIIGSVTPGL